MRRLAACLIVLIAPGGAAVAEDWDWTFTPYAWATSTGIDVRISDQQVIGAEVEFANLVDDLDFAGMIYVEAKKEKMGVFFNVLAADFGNEPRSVGLGPITLSAESDLELTIVELGGIYNPSGDGEGFSLLYGGRIIDVDQEIDVLLPALLFGERRVFDASTTAYDALLGIRLASRFGDSWSFTTWGDVAAGSTDLTWSATAVFGYHFGAEDQLAFRFGYRHLDIGLDESDTLADVETDIEMSGALVGLTFTF